MFAGALLAVEGEIGATQSNQQSRTGWDQPRQLSTAMGLIYPHVSASSPLRVRRASDVRDLGGGKPEGFEKILVRFGRQAFELTMPAHSILGVETGSRQQCDPAILRHQPRVFGGARVTQQLDDDLLLAAKRREFVVEVGEAPVQRPAQRSAPRASGFEHGGDLTQRHTGGTQLTNACQPCLVLR